METNREHLILTEAALAACHPIVGEGGQVLRALCPFHGSDRQRSLRVQVQSGRFVCFACGAVCFRPACVNLDFPWPTVILINPDYS